VVKIERPPESGDGTRTISWLAVVRPAWKFRVESTGGEASAGYTWRWPLAVGWLAITLTATADTLAAAGTPPRLVTVAVVVPPAGTLTLLTTVVGATWTYWPASGAAAAGAMGRARVATAARRARPPASARRREPVPGAPGRGWTGVCMRRSSTTGRAIWGNRAAGGEPTRWDKRAEDTVR
jgi:hypothetical protein